MGLKSIKFKHDKNAKAFAPYMGLKRYSLEQVQGAYTFAPYMGLKRFLSVSFVFS